MDPNNPVVVNINTPPPPEPPGRFKFRLPKLPKLPGFSAEGPKMTRYITVGAAGVIVASLITFGVFAILTNNSNFKKAHNIGTSANPDLPAETSGIDKSAAALPGGGTATGVGGTSGTNSPVVTLTAQPATVIVGGKAKLKWRVTKNPTSCTASEDWSGSKAASGSETTQALSQVQTYLFTLTCKNATGTGFATVSVGATSQGGSGGSSRPVVVLAANPSAIYTGDNSTLTWDVSNKPTSCSASGNWSGGKPASGQASTGKLTTAKTYTYTLTCKNSAGSGYATVTVKASLPPPDLPLVTISGNPIGPLTPGSSSVISWSVTNNPSSCVASGDWSGSKSASGSQSTGPLNNIKTYTFILTCSNGAGSSFDNVNIVVIPKAPAVTLNVAPTSIITGNSANITWSATNNPTACTASGDWAGSKAASGSQSTGTLNTARAYLYSLSCTNAGGTGFVNNVRLNVSLPPAPMVTLTANPISIKSGSSSSLTWSTGNSPTSCTASGDWSGAKNSGGGTQSTGTLSNVKTYTYTLTCSNAGGSNSATTAVDVTSGTVTSAPVVTMAVSPTTIGTGSSATLSWSATNSPTSCTASGSWSGSQGPSGSTSTGVKSSAGSFTYTLTCSNSAGSGSKSATLTVVATPVISISVSPSTITAGSSATLSWSATNSPTSCTASGAWSGTKSASGSQTVSQSAAGNYTYTISCSNSGGNSSNSTILAVNSAGAACGAGGICHQADIAPHKTQADCWSSINADGSGQKAYKIPSSFISDHSTYKSASTVVGKLCGQVYTSNLSTRTSDHNNGKTIKSLNYSQYMSNFYIGPYL